MESVSKKVSRAIRMESGSNGLKVKPAFASLMKLGSGPISEAKMGVPTENASTER